MPTKDTAMALTQQSYRREAYGAKLNSISNTSGHQTSRVATSTRIINDSMNAMRCHKSSVYAKEQGPMTHRPRYNVSTSQVWDLSAAAPQGALKIKNEHGHQSQHGVVDCPRTLHERHDSSKGRSSTSHRTFGSQLVSKVVNSLRPSHYPNAAHTARGERTHSLAALSSVFPRDPVNRCPTARDLPKIHNSANSASIDSTSNLHARPTTKLVEQKRSCTRFHTRIFDKLPAAKRPESSVLDAAPTTTDRETHHQKTVGNSNPSSTVSTKASVSTADSSRRSSRCGTSLAGERKTVRSDSSVITDRNSSRASTLGNGSLATDALPGNGERTRRPSLARSINTPAQPVLGSHTDVDSAEVTLAEKTREAQKPYEFTTQLCRANTIPIELANVARQMHMSREQHRMLVLQSYEYLRTNLSGVRMSSDMLAICFNFGQMCKSILASTLLNESNKTNEEPKEMAQLVKAVEHRDYNRIAGKVAYLLLRYGICSQDIRCIFAFVLSYLHQCSGPSTLDCVKQMLTWYDVPNVIFFWTFVAHIRVLDDTITLRSWGNKLAEGISRGSNANRCVRNLLRIQGYRLDVNEEIFSSYHKELVVRHDLRT